MKWRGLVRSRESVVSNRRDLNMGDFYRSLEWPIDIVRGALPTSPHEVTGQSEPILYMYITAVGLGDKKL